jgi:transcriptional regulator with XRE-family HTH domain
MTDEIGAAAADDGEDRGKPVLSIAQVFAYRLRDARLTKKWSQQRLAAEMRAIGCPMTQVTIAKIEAGAQGVGGELHDEPRKSPPRPVSLAEAIGFAVVLDVPPPSLFLPLSSDDDVRLAPTGPVVDVATAHAWVRGERPLKLATASARVDEQPVTGTDVTAWVGEQPLTFDDAGAFYRFQTFPRTPTLSDLESLGIRVIQEPKKED